MSPKDKNEKPLKFLRLLPVRWSASHLAAETRLLAKFSMLTLHLEKILQDPASAKPKNSPAERAREILSFITDENFLPLLNFHVDVLSIMTIESLYYQRTSATIIGEHARLVVVL